VQCFWSVFVGAQPEPGQQLVHGLPSQPSALRSMRDIAVAVVEQLHKVTARCDGYVL
jgi:hypothetical protein